MWMVFIAYPYKKSSELVLVPRVNTNIGTRVSAGVVLFGMSSSVLGQLKLLHITDYYYCWEQWSSGRAPDCQSRGR